MVTDRRRLGNEAGSDDIGALDALVAEAVRADVDLLQIRQPDLSDRLLVEVVSRAMTAARGSGTKIIVNDRVDLAIACQADGVQLGSTGLPTNVVRIMVGSDVWIGKSVHSTEEALTAQRDGAHLILLGTIFQSRSHPDFAGIGIGEIQRTCSVIDLPVIAIGGINQYNVADVVHSGAMGAAVISAIMGSSDPYGESHILSEIINNTKLTVE